MMQSSSTRAKVIRNSISVILVALMVMCAEITGERDFIFPEIGALCIGLWIVNKHVWRVRKWQIPVLFTLAAVVGVCIVRYATMHLAIQMELGFMAVALMLMAFDASITPAISACMLPVLMQTTSWLYPIVVLASTTILALGQYAMEKLSIRDVADNNLKFSVAPSKTSILGRWIMLMAILAPILVVAPWLGCKFVMVPPLIVTMVEFSNSASNFRTRPISIWLTLVLAACLGTFAQDVLHNTLGIWQCLCAAIATASILFYFNRSGKFFAPAVAITLVPMILPTQAVPFFPIYVAIGAAYFIGVALFITSRSIFTAK